MEPLSVDGLDAGEVLIKVAYSSVNYKDALAGTGQGKILRRFPLVGGIDVAGEVVASTDPAFREGDAVLVTGCGLSETRDGGYSQYVRLESKWAIPLPAGLSLREAMVLGTAGFTAALAIENMQTMGLKPDSGPVAVTGATGGVGSVLGAVVGTLLIAMIENILILSGVNANWFMFAVGAMIVVAVVLNTQTRLKAEGIKG